MDTIAEKLVPALEYQLSLKSSDFKTPLQVIQKNFKNMQRLVEKQSGALDEFVGDVTPDKLREAISQFETFTKRMEVRVRNYNEFIDRLERRLLRLKELESIVEQVKLGGKDGGQLLLSWYKDEINLLLCKFLVSVEDDEIFVKLVESLGFEGLIDHDVIRQGNKIYNEIKHKHNLNILVEWCTENKRQLKSLREDSADLEFEAYYQKFIELVKVGKVNEAIKVAQKSLSMNKGEAQTFDKMRKAAGLIFFSALKDETPFVKRDPKPYDIFNSEAASGKIISNNLKRFSDLLSNDKWGNLADNFLENYNLLYGINPEPELLILLSMGISSLKTKSCQFHGKNQFQDQGTDQLEHSQEVDFSDFVSQSEMVSSSSVNNDCPVCSAELFELGKYLPFAHIVTSNISGNPVKLPNGDIYDLDKLIKYNANVGKEDNLEGEDIEVVESSEEGDSFDEDDDGEKNDGKNWIDSDIRLLNMCKIKDPMTGEAFRVKDLARVFPT